ncbi:hypothetical protein MNBD_CHLOROFLEXI01-78 [hydrothermal vent metagenome]|uniref:Membrane protein 6-pyruvoyl-tetrahydropterin synthase-related domain-containing protein n=1 Tax=hydrothermal vent metagenome TaxID=652676 RepID=A0A3B0VX19_9ZZZZ
MRATWPWLAVLLIVLLAAQPLWGLPPQGDDLLLHIYRIPLLNSQWANGVFFSRWQPDLIYGYGSPLFTFYPPLSAYLLTLLYWLVGQQAAVAINLLLALSLLLGAVGMFGLGRALAGELGGLLATAVFTLSPHVAAQIYSRGSISNSLALGLVPLVAWGILRVAQRPSARRTAAAALGLALLMLSHTASSLLLLGPLLIWGGVATACLRVRLSPVGDVGAVYGKESGQRRWLLLFGLGLALSAFAWLPALSEIQFTKYAAEAAKVDYADHFTSLWDWPGQAINGLRGAYLPKTVGLMTLLLGGVGTAVSGLSLWRWWRVQGKPFPSRDALFLTAGLLGWGVLFLTTPASDGVWRLVAPLRGLQFPWRLLDVPAFFLPLAGMSLFNYTGSRSYKRYWVRGGMGVVILFAYVNLIPYLYPPRQQDLPTRPTLMDVTAVQQNYQIMGLTAWGEYSDAHVTAWPPAPPFPNADAGATLASKLLTAVPEESLTLLETNPWQAVWQTNFAQPQTLIWAVHTFPGWQARLDGAPLSVTSDENGRLQLTLPAGRQTLELRFGRTPVRWLADVLSLAGLLIGLFLAAKKPAETKVTEIPLSLRYPAAPLIILLVGLLATKLIWLDRFNSPLVVQPENGRIPGIPSPSSGNFNDEIRLVGAVTEPPNQLTLYWQAIQPPAQAYRVALTLLDAQGVPQQTIINPTPGYSVTNHWAAGQLIRDVYSLPLPDAAPAGYLVQLSVLQPDNDFPLSLMDDSGNMTTVVGRLKQPPLETAVPDEATPIGTHFGEAIVLSHAAVPETVSLREPLEFSLFWQSEAAVADDYTVFVHLLTPEGEFVTGQDGQPLGGLYPTSFWEAGEIVVDGRSWFVDVPPGEYQLQVGLYLLATGERLSVSGPNSALGDRVLVQNVTVAP